MLAWLTLRMLIFDRGGNSVKSAEISHEGTQRRNKTSGGLLSIYFCVIFSKWIPVNLYPIHRNSYNDHAAWVTCDQITHSLASLSHYIKTKPSYQLANFLYKKTSGSAFVPKLKFTKRFQYSPYIFNFKRNQAPITIHALCFQLLQIMFHDTKERFSARNKTLTTRIWVMCRAARAAQNVK